MFLGHHFVVVGSEWEVQQGQGTEVVKDHQKANLHTRTHSNTHIQMDLPRLPKAVALVAAVLVLAWFEEESMRSAVGLV